VQSGDTLSVIAQRFNTTLNALAQLNGIANPNRIFAGQRLIVPSAGGTGGPNTVPTSPALPTTQPPVIITATPVVSAPSTYVVQPGDSLYRISVRFNVSMIGLARANNITNYNLVFAGSTLVIPK
jgi:LysM repeat protein